MYFQKRETPKSHKFTQEIGISVQNQAVLHISEALSHRFIHLFILYFCIFVAERGHRGPIPADTGRKQGKPMQTPHRQDLAYNRTQDLLDVQQQTAPSHRLCA